jgi:MFS family permease
MHSIAVREKTRAAFGLRHAILVALMFGFSVMSYFDRTILSIAGPSIMKEFDIPPPHMGWVYSAFILGYAIFMIPGGWVADRLGPRNTLALMGLAAALCTALTPLGGMRMLAGSMGVVAVLFAVRFALGVVSAPLYPACGRMGAQRIHPVHQGRAQAFIIAGACMGGAVSPIVFSWMMSIFRWRGSFYLAAVATALGALIWLAYVRELPSETEHRHSSVRGFDWALWRRLLTDRNLMLLTFAYFTLGYFEYIFFYWIYYYFGEVLHTGYERSARYTTVIFLTMMVIMPLGGWISDRLTRSYGEKFGRRIVPMTGLTLAAILLYLGTMASEGVTVALMAVSIGMGSVCEGPFWALAIDIGGEQVGAAGGILNAGGNIGGFFSPVVTPYVALHLGWTWGLYLGSVMVILGAVACYFVNPQEKRFDRPGAITT